MSHDRGDAALRGIRLHLLRHAHAGDPAAWDGDDALRPLTRKGRRQAERLGALLEAHGVRPDVIVSSPKVRALQTAELVATALGMTVRQDERLAEGFGPGDLAQLLSQLGALEPMLVGHDPDLSGLLNLLLDSHDVPMRKGTLATVDLVGVERGAGRLCWLIPPELLAHE